MVAQMIGRPNEGIMERERGRDALGTESVKIENTCVDGKVIQEI